jgi:NAD(P)-dependent dehydrogenase (short-subunit alcohol dehydrogenase family)
MNLTNKVVLLTGASGGIGEATALAFDKEGCRVAIASRNTEKLGALARLMHNPLVIPADLSDLEQARKMVDTAVEYFGRIDILINNAASIIVSPAETVSSEDLLQAFTVNMVSPAAATQRAVMYMKQSGGGHIINVGSPGFMLGIPFYAPYVCSKAAFSAWTRTIQAEWAGTEIKVSEYFPGYIKTDSRPYSRIGIVEQDFLMTENPGFLARTFTAPKTAEFVAHHLVKLAQHPRTLMYSDFSVKIGALISNIPGFRLSLSHGMAKTARKKLT